VCSGVPFGTIGNLSKTIGLRLSLTPEWLEFIFCVITLRFVKALFYFWNHIVKI